MVRVGAVRGLAAHGRVHGIHAPRCILAVGHDDLATPLMAGPTRIASSQALTTSRWRLDSGDTADLLLDAAGRFSTSHLCAVD
jgi:hypothetical protein